jgi:hypothetical protein
MSSWYCISLDEMEYEYDMEMAYLAHEHVATSLKLLQPIPVATSLKLVRPVGIEYQLHKKLSRDTQIHRQVLASAHEPVHCLLPPPPLHWWCRSTLLHLSLRLTHWSLLLLPSRGPRLFTYSKYIFTHTHIRVRLGSSSCVCVCARSCVYRLTNDSKCKGQKGQPTRRIRL